MTLFYLIPGLRKLSQPVENSILISYAQYITEEQKAIVCDALEKYYYEDRERRCASKSEHFMHYDLRNAEFVVRANRYTPNSGKPM